MGMRQLVYAPNKSMDGDTKYSRLTKIPQYTPSDNPPSVDALFNYGKYTELLNHIEASNVTEEEKKFLRYGATRHIIFNYGMIADYYASATPEMQKLMEESALVIIDFDDAIANGYVKLSKRLEAIRNDPNLAKKAKDFE